MFPTGYNLKQLNKNNPLKKEKNNKTKFKQLNRTKKIMKRNRNKTNL